jgi:hypothetical protein
MAQSKANPRVVGTGAILDHEGLAALHRRLVDFRLASLHDDGSHERRMLYFVQGLRFSAELIYEVRNLLSSAAVKVHWGHILRGDDILCSPECDIILHSDGKRRRWNGNHEEPVFDFWFVKPEAVSAVISCKSLIRSPSDIDDKYCQELRGYGVKRIWLFAECCDRAKVESIATRAKRAGYDRFFHLYTLDSKTGSDMPSKTSWVSFAKAVRALEKRARNRKP